VKFYISTWLPCGVVALRQGWVRLWPDGPGVGWKDVRVHHPLYSERSGSARAAMFGRWLFKPFGIAGVP
jgi:hypothetical protein